MPDGRHTDFFLSSGFSRPIQNLSSRSLRRYSVRKFPSFLCPFHLKAFAIFLPVTFGKVRYLSFRFIRERSLSFFPFHSGMFVIFLFVSFGNVRYPSFLSAVSAPLTFPCSILPSSAVLRTEAKARSAKARYRSFLSRIFSGNGARIPKLAFMG